MLAVGYTDGPNIVAARQVLDGLLRQQSRHVWTAITQALRTNSRSEALIYRYEVQGVACGIILCGRWRCVQLGEEQGQTASSTSVSVKEIVKIELQRSPDEMEKHEQTADESFTCDAIRVTISLPAGSGYTHTVLEQPLEALMEQIRKFERPAESILLCSSLGALFGRSRGEGYIRI